MWDLFINPLVTLLTALYAVLGNNIVLAIVVLTVLIRIVTYPLFARQQRSTRAMQELQPQLKKIQEKYKNDREKLTQAQMELYRKHGVNPLGGCLPLLIQFPILIGLYQAIIFGLASTPFQLVDLSQRLILPGFDALIPLENTWLGMDLTQPPNPPLNPAYALALPLLVVVTTWLQTRMTMPKPAPRDPNSPPDQTQAMTQSMTTVMPLMFGMFSLSFSVGLSIYFIVSNIISVAQYSPVGKKLMDRLFGHQDKPLPVMEDIDIEVEEVVKPDRGNKETKKDPKRFSAKPKNAAPKTVISSKAQKKRAR